MGKRYYKRNRKKINSTSDYVIKSVIFFAVGFFAISSTKDFSSGSLFLGIGLLFLIPVAILLIQQKIRKQKYLNSSLYLIDHFTGEQFEEYLKAHFEKLGYRVTLTPKTADYGVDLICFKKTENGYIDKFVVQAKRYNGKVGISAIQQIVGGLKYYGCEKGYVITNSYFTHNAVELANASNITLWDRNTLSEKFKIENNKK